jgi:amino acid transporter
VVLAVGAVAAWGVRESVTSAGILTLVEVGGLLAVIGFGSEHLAALPARLHEFAPMSPGGWDGVAGAAILAFYAFLGFEDMVNVAEEVRDVRRVLPRGILLTLVLTAGLYVATTVVAVLAVPPQELAGSEAPLSLVFERCGGPAALLGGIAILALLNGALVQVIKASRVLFAMAGQGALPASLGHVHPRTRTPLVATAATTLATIGFALALPLATLAETTSLVTLVTFTLANLALVVVKRRDPRPEGVTTFPIWIPALGFAFSLGFVVLEGFQHV